MKRIEQIRYWTSRHPAPDCADGYVAARLAENYRQRHDHQDQILSLNPEARVLYRNLITDNVWQYHAISDDNDRVRLAGIETGDSVIELKAHKFSFSDPPHLVPFSVLRHAPTSYYYPFQYGHFIASLDENRTPKSIVPYPGQLDLYLDPSDDGSFSAVYRREHDVILGAICATPSLQDLLWSFVLHARSGLWDVRCNIRIIDSVAVEVR